ncbi:MAG: flagellar protein FliT [Halioglobus sp.]|nr:flagellar protein FliT [Halioglobus sp.]
MDTESQPRTLPDQVHQCRRLAQVLQMTRQMLAHAEQGDWEAVTEMERERRDDLVQCFSEPIPLGDSDLVAQAIATLLHLNEELMSKLKDAHSQMLDKSLEFNRSKEAISSYKSMHSAV